MNEQAYWDTEDYLESCDAAEEQHDNEIPEDDNDTL